MNIYCCLYILSKFFDFIKISREMILTVTAFLWHYNHFWDFMILVMKEEAACLLYFWRSYRNRKVSALGEDETGWSGKAETVHCSVKHSFFFKGVTQIFAMKQIYKLLANLCALRNKQFGSISSSCGAI